MRPLLAPARGPAPRNNEGVRALVDREVTAINGYSSSPQVKLLVSSLPAGQLLVLGAWSEMSRLMILGLSRNGIVKLQGTCFGETDAAGRNIYHVFSTPLLTSAQRPPSTELIDHSTGLVFFDNVDASVVARLIQRHITHPSGREYIADRPTHLAYSQADEAALIARQYVPRERG